MPIRFGPVIQQLIRPDPVSDIRPARRSLLILAALLQALPISAQTKSEPAGKSDEVVVVGRNGRERDKQIRDFVRGMTAGRGTDPLARFDREKLCAQVVGLEPQYNEAIIKRMRRVAAAATIDVAHEDCRHPNAVVIFADDKTAMLALLRKQYSWLFRDPHGNPVAVGKEKGPAFAWHVTGLVTREGAALPPGDLDGIVRLPSTAPPSRLEARVRPVYLMSIVVVERRGVDGLTATQIADYAAMRVLSDADPARARELGVPTVLTVLEAAMGSETPLSLTAWDLSFLRGLYAAPLNSFSGAQRGMIASDMQRQLDKSGTSNK
jgi:hypothetical protein